MLVWYFVQLLQKMEWDHILVLGSPYYNKISEILKVQRENTLFPCLGGSSKNQ